MRLTLIALAGLVLAGCAEQPVATTMYDPAGNKTTCVGQVLDLSLLNSVPVVACTPENFATDVTVLDNGTSPGKAALDVGAAAVQGASFFLPFAFAQGWL